METCTELSDLSNIIQLAGVVAAQFKTIIKLGASLSPVRYVTFQSTEDNVFFI